LFGLYCSCCKWHSCDVGVGLSSPRRAHPKSAFPSEAYVSQIRDLLAGNRKNLSALFVIILLLTCACFAQPTVTLSNSSGPPTTKLLVSGSGYDPYSAVDIYFDAKDEALAVTDGNGAFGKIGITVPGSAKPGGHWITGVERYKGLAGQSHFLVNTDWPQFHFSPDHQGINPYENVLSPSNVTRLRVRWSHLLDNESGGPAVVNGVVYVGSGSSVYALDAKTGVQVWQKSGFSCDDTCSPAVVNGTVYIGSTDHNLYALSARTGTEIWRYTTGGTVSTSPTVADGVVYVSSDDGYLHALDARSGTPKWDYFYVFPSSPAVANGIVYIEAFSALDAATGAVLWRTGTGGPSEPAVANGLVHFGTNNDFVYAFNAQSGELVWTYITDGIVDSSPVVANGVV